MEISLLYTIHIARLEYMLHNEIHIVHIGLMCMGVWVHKSVFEQRMADVSLSIHFSPIWKYTNEFMNFNTHTSTEIQAKTAAYLLATAATGDFQANYGSFMALFLFHFMFRQTNDGCCFFFSVRDLHIFTCRFVHFSA